MTWTRIRTAACFAALLLTTAGSAILAGNCEGDPPAAKAAETQAAGRSVTTPVVTDPVLPEGCDPLDRHTSPDGRRVAFVGDYTPTTPAAQVRHGLFVVNLVTKEVRQLIDKAVDGKDPQRETIADLAINAPVPALEAALGRANQGVAALEAPAAIKPEKRSLLTGPFAAWCQDPPCRRPVPIAGLHVLPRRRGRPRAATTMGPSDAPGRARTVPWRQEPAAGDAILVILFDAHGRPIGSAHAMRAAAREPVVLDLGSFNSLGSAKSWSLTILAKDGPHSVAPAAPSPQTVAEAFPVRPGEAQVVQVDAVPDWRSPRDRAMEPDVAPTRLRTLQFAVDGQGALGATLELRES